MTRSTTQVQKAAFCENQNAVPIGKRPFIVLGLNIGFLYPGNFCKSCHIDLVIEVTDITDDGNTSGICINDAGADGKYADFIFAGSMNKENPGVPLDLKKFYRQIPEGKSTWVRNYSAGTITFTDANGKVTTGSLVGAGKEDLGNGLSMTVQNNAFAFNLNGTDDWSAIYSDYDKFAKKARRYWISVVKR